VLSELPKERTMAIKKVKLKVPATATIDSKNRTVPYREKSLIDCGRTSYRLWSKAGWTAQPLPDLTFLLGGVAGLDEKQGCRFSGGRTDGSKTCANSAVFM
jgi:hypothetical protein